MKYKCLKDYWMHNESEENGNIPAFKAGAVYEFFVGKESSHNPQLYTPKDNQGSGHYMDQDAEFDEYFELVEE